MVFQRPGFLQILNNAIASCILPAVIRNDELIIISVKMA